MTHRDEAARVFTVEENDALQRPPGEVEEGGVEGGDDGGRAGVHHHLGHVLEGARRRESSADVAEDHLAGAAGGDETEVLCLWYVLVE